MTPAFSLYLDLLRLFAAGLVFVSHLDVEPVSGKMLWMIANHGTEGVVLFFVLSGFVIGHVAARREQTARDYAVARAARIYSVAVLAIFVTLAADAIGMRLAPGLYLDHSPYNSATGPGEVASALSFTNELWNRHSVLGTNEAYWS